MICGSRLYQDHKGYSMSVLNQRVVSSFIEVKCIKVPGILHHRKAHHATTVVLMIAFVSALMSFCHPRSVTTHSCSRYSS